MAETRVEVVPPDQCFELLGRARVGRIGITVDALPVILPLEFAMSFGSVIFRIVAGAKLSAATENRVVAFEADDDSRSGWSVLVESHLRSLTPPRWTPC